jgi:hypothetical protein
MKRNRSRASVITGTVGLFIALGSPAYGVTINTRRVVPPPDGSVVCTALNLSGKAVGITAQIMNDGAINVTDWIQTQWQSEDEGILSAVISQSNADDARYCRVIVTGGRKSDVSVLVETFSADGGRTSFATPR